MNIVVVFPKEEIALKINNILVKNGFQVAAVCSSGAKALQAIERLEEGIIISGIRYKDMMYYDLKQEIKGNFEMILIASQQQWDSYGEDDAIFLSVPFKAYELLELVEDYELVLEKKRKKKKSAVRNEKEESLIHRAKDYLMETHDWTEPEAHRYLQKNSMDTGRSLVETAALIMEFAKDKK